MILPTRIFDERSMSRAVAPDNNTGRGSLATTAFKMAPLDASFSIITDSPTLLPPLPSPMSESEYTSFVKASPSPPQRHRTLNLCLTPSSQDDDSTVEPFYLQTPPPWPLSPPPLTLATRTVSTFLPPPPNSDEHGTEHPKEDFVTFVDDCFASGKERSLEEMQDDDNKNNHHSDNDGIWSRRRTNPTLLQSKSHEYDELLMQPNLMLDAPTGIMLMFDRMLDCMDAPGGRMGLEEKCHRMRQWPASSNAWLLDRTTRLLDDDGQSISTIDSVVQELVESSSFPSGVLDKEVPTISYTDASHRLPMISPPIEGGDDTLCLFPCWDVGDVIKVETTAKHRKKKDTTVTLVPPRRRSTTRRVSAALHVLEDVEKTANIRLGSSLKLCPSPLDTNDNSIPPNAPQRPKLRSRSIFYDKDEIWDPKVECPVQENNRKRNLSAIDDGGNEETEEAVDDDEDSLSKLLRGLDFEPPFDEMDELSEIDRIHTPDCASSYSSLTY
jgi:hypothetical protein